MGLTDPQMIRGHVAAARPPGMSRHEVVLWETARDRILPLKFPKVFQAKKTLF